MAFDVESLITLDPVMAKLACNVNHIGRMQDVEQVLRQMNIY